MSDRVLLCGAWDEGAGYPRTRSLRIGLEASGTEVRECRVSGIGRAKQRLLQRPWTWPGAWLRQRRDRDELLRTLVREVDAFRPHAVFVPYPGHTLVRAIRDRIAAPVAFDMFLSAYDTVVEDRGLVRPGSLLARHLQLLDTRACAAADLCVLDTPENAAYVQQLTGLPADRFTWLPVHDPDAPSGAEAPYRAPVAGGPLEVLFFGTGVPLHGLSVLIAAVAQVPEVRLTLVGGTDADRAEARLRLGERVDVLPEFVSRERLAELLAATQLVAGVFGASGKAQRVVPFKVVHALAAGRPVLTAETPAMLRWLDGSGAVIGCAAADPVGLAGRLRALVRDPSPLASAAAVASDCYRRHFGTARLAERCREVLGRLNPVRFSGVA